jgi:hypothetical protein
MQQPGGVSDLASSYRFPEQVPSSLMTPGRNDDRTLRFGHLRAVFVSTIHTDIKIAITLRRQAAL